MILAICFTSPAPQFAIHKKKGAVFVVFPDRGPKEGASARLKAAAETDWGKDLLLTVLLLCTNLSKDKHLLYSYCVPGTMWLCPAGWLRRGRSLSPQLCECASGPLLFLPLKLS